MEDNLKLILQSLKLNSSNIPIQDVKYSNTGCKIHINTFNTFTKLTFKIGDFHDYLNSLNMTV